MTDAAHFQETWHSTDYSELTGHTGTDEYSTVFISQAMHKRRLLCYDEERRLLPRRVHVRKQESVEECLAAAANTLGGMDL